MLKLLPTFIVAMLCALLTALGSPASALIEGTDIQRVNLRDTPTSGTAVWSSRFQKREDGLYVKSGAERQWIQLPSYAVGSGKRPPREAVVTATLGADGFRPSEVSAFVRYSADGQSWTTWCQMSVAKAPGNAIVFEESLCVPRVARVKFDRRLEEWMAKGGNARDEQDMFTSWLKRHDPAVLKTEIPYIRVVEVRFEMEKVARLGLARDVVVETHWTARIEGE